MRKLLFLLMLLIILVSCTKKVTETEVITDSWSIDKRILGDEQFLLNTRIVDDKLQILSPYTIGYLSLLDNTREVWVSSYHYCSKSRVYMNNNYIIGASDDKTAIFINSFAYLDGCPLMFNNGEYFDIYLKPSTLDSTFTSNARILTSWYQSDYIVSNGDRQFLFYFNESSNEDPSKNGTYFCLVDFSIIPIPEANLGYGYQIDHFVIKKISDYRAAIYALNYHNGVYYCSAGDGTGNNYGANYTISSTGEVNEIPIQFFCTSFFEYQNKLWTKSGHYLWNSEDGITWTQTPYTLSKNVNFFVYENKLCAYDLSCIYEIDLETITIYYLDMSGLDYHTITAINFSNDKVYLSTLGGLYARPKPDFFKNKSTTAPTKGNGLRFL